jgi:predicted kinase
LATRQNKGIVITHGVSGSGKSRHTRDLPGRLPAVRLRSDVERKRLLDLQADQSATQSHAYSSAFTERVYTHLLELTRLIVQAGRIAIIDATFLNPGHRLLFLQLAQAQNAPFAIIHCSAPVDTLRARIQHRKNKPDNVSDADVDVMLGQLEAQTLLTPEEQARTLFVAPDSPLSADALMQLLSDPTGN